MNQARAQAEAERLNDAHPERERFEWTAVRRDEDRWAVVKAPRRGRVDPLKATTEAAPKPAQPEDPRFGPLSDIPGYG